MHLWLDVDSRVEGDQIRRGLADPVVRAFVQIMGALLLVQDDQNDDEEDLTRVNGDTPGAADRI